MAISFVQISIELFETLKVLASKPGYVFQSDYLGLTRVTARPFARPLRWKNVEIDLLPRI